ncbi:MAG: retroviral-like aspartic protease family protein, partial [Verrucomicrobiota bacterium]|nr:retroviral-like aspartic protease family protein [Verrucomicrobiota bacterium]
MAASAVSAANEVKIERAHGLLWTTVCAKGQSFHFVIDTGASITVLSPEAARRLDMPWGRPTRVEAIGGTARGYQSSEFPGLLAGLALPSKVLVMDLSDPSRSCGRVIDGLIGADFFQGKIAQLDYQAGTLRFLDCVPAGKNAVPSRFESGVVCVRLAPAGAKAGWVRLDTGCTDALHWT